MLLSFLDISQAFASGKSAEKAPGTALIDKARSDGISFGLMNIPNTLTLFRIIAIPALVVILLTNFKSKEIVAFCLFVLTALTDMLDGFLARRRKQITVLGQLLDPIADKLLVTAVFICLVETGAVPAWIVVIIIGREMAVTGFRAISSSQGINIPASTSGKVKMNAEIYTLALLILGRSYLGKLYILSQIGLWVVVLSALFSAAEYAIKYGPRVLMRRP